VNNTLITLYGPREGSTFLRGVRPPSRETLEAARRRHALTPFIIAPLENELFYAVRQANLKALQLGASWLYVVREESYLQEFPEHWAWVRLQLGHNANTAPEAWSQLREATDTYWADEGTGPDGVPWAGYPWVRNIEHFLTQRDVEPDGAPVRGSERHVHVLDRSNGTAWEGLRTSAATGQDAFYFDLDDDFAGDGKVDIQLTFVDDGSATFAVEAMTPTGVARSTPVTTGNTGLLYTATVQLTAAVFSGAFAGATDLVVRRLDGGDLELQRVRVIRAGLD
jgi:hypothetical protein